MKLDLRYLKRIQPAIPPENLAAHEEYVRYHERRFAVCMDMLQSLPLKQAAVLSVGLEPGYFEAYLASEYACSMSGTELPKHHPTGFRYEIVFDDTLRGHTLRMPMVMAHAGTDPLPFPDAAFDVVLLLEVIEHLLCRADYALNELRRVTKPGGYLLLSTPNAQHWHRLSSLLEGRRYPDTEFTDDLSHRHHQLFSRLELSELLQASGFTIVNSRFEDCYDLAQGQSLRDVPILQALSGRAEFEKENIFMLAKSESRGGERPRAESSTSTLSNPTEPNVPTQSDRDFLARELFDEAFYVETYPDIKAALVRGDLRSAWEHYVHHGWREGRETFRFDEEFYASSYPIARDEIEAGLAISLRDHYMYFGRFRGYLPHSSAPRPGNPIVMPPFLGLWPDAPNAPDVIAGKLEAGLIDQRHADLLTFWMLNGFVILEQAIPEHELELALADLDKAYSGGFDSVQFECPAASQAMTRWQPCMNDLPAKAIDMHYFSTAIRDVIFSAQVRSFLHVVFESKALVTQTLAFYRGSGQDPHQDSAYVAYSLPRAFLASWIALEDVSEGGGELYYFEGSHRLSDFLYAEKYKSVHEALRAGVLRDAVYGELARHVAGLPVRSEAAGLRKRTFRARRGDVLFWHADLAHGGSPLSPQHTRKSIVTHYCPRRIAPLYMENRALQIREHGDKGYYVTSYYE